MALDYTNAHFSSPTGGFTLTSTTISSDLGQLQADFGEEQCVPIMTLKPGSDNVLPSPNGIIASNLLLLSSYLEEPSFKIMAKRTIDAFAIEIIQHPFLFVSMLSAIVLEAVGVKGIVVVGGEAAHTLGGFGRTVVGLQDEEGERWLRDRNPLLHGLRLRDGKQGRVMICEAGTCRELEKGELEAPGKE